MHPHQDIAPSHKLASNKQLWDGWPITILLDPTPQVFILEHIERREFARVNALKSEDLDQRARETTLWRFGCAFHEEDDGGGGYGFVYCGADLLRQEAGLEEGSVYSRCEGG